MKSIFIVEDEWELAENLEEILSISGYTVVGIEATGEQAYLKILESQPDLILMDVNLNGRMDGIELSEQIRKKSGIPIIFSTAQLDRSFLRKISELNHSFILHKPYTKTVLISSVNNALLKHFEKK